MVVGVKKPAGTAEEVEKHFGCASSELIMVTFMMNVRDDTGI